jgi:D-tyrosyl-tRNA(Tyr) deacylase
MRGLIQRVSQASVEVDGEIVGEIRQGLLLLLGVQKGDTQEQAQKLLHKISHYRIFADEQQKMNLSVKDIAGGLLIVSQFTLAAETHKGLRPGFSTAAEPALAKDLYEYFVSQAQDKLSESNVCIETGIFGADMKVSLLNDGPVTFMIEV